jgi:hypothetical protein
MAEQLQYWQDVADEMIKITAECARQQLQKAPALVYITSIVSRKNRISNARVCGANLKLAATRICDGSHRVSTDDEIAAHLAEQEKKREEQKSREAALKGQISFSGAPPIPSVTKGE